MSSQNDVGCESVSNYLQVIVSGLENIPDLISLDIFPNPVYESLNIEFNTSSKLDFDIQVFHSNGKLTKERFVEVLGFQTIAFDFSELSAGVYFVKLKNSGQQSIQKIIKF